MKTAQRPCPKWHPQPLRSSSAVLTHMAPSALAVILCTLPHGLLGNSPLLIFAPMYARQKVSKKMYVGCLWAHARKIQWQMRHRKVMVTSQKSLYSELRNHFIYSVFQRKWHDSLCSSCSTDKGCVKQASGLPAVRMSTCIQQYCDLVTSTDSENTLWKLKWQVGNPMVLKSPISDSYQ